MSIQTASNKDTEKMLSLPKKPDCYVSLFSLEGHGKLEDLRAPKLSDCIDYQHQPPPLNVQIAEAINQQQKNTVARVLPIVGLFGVYFASEQGLYKAISAALCTTARQALFTEITMVGASIGVLSFFAIDFVRQAAKIRINKARLQAAESKQSGLGKQYV